LRLAHVATEIAATGASPHFSIVLPAADVATVRALRDRFEVGLPLPPADWPRQPRAKVIAMTPDVWADYNQIDDDGHVLVYLEDIVRAERVVVGGTVIVADPEAKAHTAVVVVLSPSGTVSLDVDRSSRPHGKPRGLDHGRLNAMASAEVDIAVDFMDVTNDGRLWTRLADMREGSVPVAGRSAIVGCDGAEPAVAPIISVDIERGITVKVLDGSVEEHRHLLPPA
jgi:hypothetical protein